MPYHIKKSSLLGSAIPTDGNEYYAGDNHWTNIYENRKVYVNEATETRITGGKTYTYQPTWWKNAVVVSE